MYDTCRAGADAESRPTAISNRAALDLVSIW